MFSLKVKNKNGDTFDITGDRRYSVIAINGLNPPTAVINTTTVAMTDGSRFNSSRVSARNIVLTIKLLNDVENARINLYKFFKTKQPCDIYFENEKRKVHIDGYTETFDIDLFSQDETAQISIICPQPYFKDLNTIYVEISKVLSMFEFPFSIESSGIEFSVIEKTLTSTVLNSGDVDTGVVIELSANGRVLQPKIYNTYTREMFGLNVDMEDGDLIKINTYKGEKSVVLLKDGISTNIINRVMENSVWFRLSPGDNVFTFACSEGEEFFDMRLIHVNLYEGV